jgi:hypothetical protein
MFKRCCPHRRLGVVAERSGARERGGAWGGLQEALELGQARKEESQPLTNSLDPHQYCCKGGQRGQ